MDQRDGGLSEKLSFTGEWDYYGQRTNMVTLRQQLTLLIHSNRIHRIEKHGGTIQDDSNSMFSIPR